MIKKKYCIRGPLRKILKRKIFFLCIILYIFWKLYLRRFSKFYLNLIKISISRNIYAFLGLVFRKYYLVIVNQNTPMTKTIVSLYLCNINCVLPSAKLWQTSTTSLDEKNLNFWRKNIYFKNLFKNKHNSIPGPDGG